MTDARRRSRRLADKEGRREDRLEVIKSTVQQHAEFFSETSPVPGSRAPASSRQPINTPDFTIGTLRKAIPAHCFERSSFRSFSHLFLDLTMIAALYLFSSHIHVLARMVSTTVPHIPEALAEWTMWALYWFFQGAVCTGVWVLAHECGHQAFSKYQSVNDGVGLLFHSLLLVPYHSWKFSHARHHANTGSVAKDEVFVPTVKDGVESHWSIEQFGPYRLVKLIVALTLGWPAYLMFNVKSRPYEGHSWVNHFDPWSPIFSKRQRVEIVVSDVSLAAVMYGLYLAGNSWGWAWLARTYFVPYLIVNFWLVMITLLQHTHPDLPHYTDKEWDWLRGALATVDRSYGWLLNTLHHHIADTHVTHHLFSQMPHYHAQEATEAIKPILGPYYKKDDRWIFRALWEDYSACRYVCEDEDERGRGSGILWQRP
jgi:omega-6 fatty acid desaturase (delta-12 desaturase)